MHRSLLATCILLLLAPLAGWSQTVSFSSNSFSPAPTGTFAAHGDFNNDGREDFAGYGYNNGFCCLVVNTSNGDGSYSQTFNVPVIGWGPAGGPIVVGDFNGDGNLDIAVGAGNSIQVFFGDGTGRFGNAVITSLPSGEVPFDMVTGDLRHTGKSDLVVSTGGTVRTFFSNGDGTFAAGPVAGIVFPNFAHLLLGDFDGNGVTDLAAWYDNNSGTATVTALYGTGNGNFSGPSFTADMPTQSSVIAADLNGDGRTDLIAADEPRNTSGVLIPQNSLTVLYGTSSSGLTRSTISLSHGCAGAQVAVADFSGHGRSDIAVPEVTCGQPIRPDSETVWYIMPNLGGGTFGAEQPFFFATNSTAYDAVSVRLNADTKPDLAFTSGGNAWVFLNTTTGNYPSCAAPLTARGVNVCAPAAGSTVASPVRFAAAASGAPPMRDIQVWVDGSKRAEQLYGFSHYTFMDKNISLSSGSHSVTVIAAGWDEQVQKKSFTLTVAPCAAPSTNGVHICAPTSGAVLASPVEVIATGRVSGTIARMELWDNGVKKYTASSTTHLSHAQALTPGSHKLTVYAINTAGTRWSSSVTVSVQ